MTRRPDIVTCACRSCRKRYTYYVIGQLMQIALTFYNVVVDVTVVDERQEDDGCHVTFRLDFVNRKTGSVSAESRSPLSSDSRRQLTTVNGATFFTVKKYRRFHYYTLKI